MLKMFVINKEYIKTLILCKNTYKTNLLY